MAALSDQRFDRPAPTMMIGTIASSSRRVTVNSEPLRVDALIGLVREAIEPPSSTATPVDDTANVA